eukprot:1780313-Prymnesium_polylepis.1
MPSRHASSRCTRQAGRSTRRSRLLCQPPGRHNCPDDAQLGEHRKALRVCTPPSAIFYTDEASCALD